MKSIIFVIVLGILGFIFRPLLKFVFSATRHKKEPVKVRETFHETVREYGGGFNPKKFSYCPAGAMEKYLEGQDLTTTKQHKPVFSKPTPKAKERIKVGN